MKTSIEPPRILRIAFWTAAIPLIFGPVILAAWLLLDGFRLTTIVMTAGVLLWCIAVPCNIACLIILLGWMLRHRREEEFRALWRGRCLRIMLLLLFNYPAAALVINVAINSFEMNTVVLVNSSGKHITRAILRASERYGGRSLWEGELPIGEARTVPLELRPMDGEGEVTLLFDIAGKASSCTAVGYAPPSGISRVQVNPDVSCATKSMGMKIVIRSKEDLKKLLQKTLKDNTITLAWNEYRGGKCR